MTTKTFTFRYDPDDDVGKWMREQSKKSDSLEAAIRTIIGNYGYEDYNKVAPKQVKLNNANNITGKDSKTSDDDGKETVVESKKKSNSTEKQEEVREKSENKTSIDDALDMFSSL